MEFNFSFRSVSNSSELKALVDFLIKNNPGYKGYEDWVQRSEYEMDAGYKRTILAYSNDVMVADLIWQPHKQLPRTKEIKNLRVHPALRRRAFGYFMLRQAEHQEHKAYDAIICDVRSGQVDAINLLKQVGYTSIVSASLYDPHEEDIVMIKAFDEISETGVIHKATNMILGSKPKNL